MNLKQARQAILIFALLLLAAGSGWWLRGVKKSSFNQGSARPEVNLSLFWDVWSRLEDYYLDKTALDPQKMVYGAIKGLTQSLGDPYTVFLDPQENKQAKEDLDGSFGGVGIQLGFKEKRLAVMSALKGTPAEKAGIKAGDLILKIVDKKKGIDQETTGISLPEAVELIRGPIGQPVILTLLSSAETNPREIELVRATIVVASAEVEFIDTPKGKVAHLKLTRFGDRTPAEWEKVSQVILAPNLAVRGLVLDVRNNPGGYLDGAVWVASEFLSDGVVAKQEGKENRAYAVDHQGKFLNIPLVVLVNEGSASAAEILAGALADRQRAKLVGTTTFGKGTVQEAQDLFGGAGLHITTGRWLLPSGKWIDQNGLTPEILVSLDENKEGDEQLERAIELLMTNG